MPIIDQDILSPSDKPALLGLNTMEWQAYVLAALKELGYKIHSANNYEDFKYKFIQYHYKVVLIEELFAATTPDENLSLKYLQTLPMNMRRHAVIILIGNSFQTLNPIQAFTNSVHAVVNGNDIQTISIIIQKVVAEND
ncbi:MAG TPA: hypothetical protein PLW02_12140, partial [Verrucomicrobiota bacterium]|nr:hypothetical protein [Verrucomicrobiota bacterium]